jgi:tripartite-type tricarboxylate transporter receptor subunit TctC
MVEYAKANPGQLRYSNVYGSVTHYVSVKMQEALGVELKDLDVGSSNADRVVALLGGQVDVLAANYITIQDYIESGEFVVMGILADERIPTLPDVPTFKEQGYDVVSLKVYTYAFPKGTDSAIIEKFDAAMEKVSKNEEFIKEIESFYGVVEYNNREDIYNLETQLVEDFKESLKDAM